MTDIGVSKRTKSKYKSTDSLWFKDPSCILKKLLLILTCFKAHESQDFGFNEFCKLFLTV